MAFEGRKLQSVSVWFWQAYLRCGIAFARTLGFDLNAQNKNRVANSPADKIITCFLIVVLFKRVYGGILEAI